MMSSLEEQPPFKEPSSPILRIQLDSASSFITPSPKKNHGDGDQFVDDKPFIDERKPSNTTVERGVLNNGEHTGDQFVDDKPFIDERKPSSTTVERGVLNNGEHTLIPVTARMIHSAVWDSKRFVLKDGRPLHMVKLVGAVRNFCEKLKHIQIDVEDGTGLMRVILWRKEKECTAQRQMIYECNSTRYIRVIGEVEDYYGVHEIIAFDVRPVSSGNEVTHHLLEVAYSFDKALEYAEDEMMRAILLE